MSGSFVRSFIQHRVFASIFTKHVSTALCTEIKVPGARPHLCPRAPGRRAGRLERGLALDGAFSSGRGTWSTRGGIGHALCPAALSSVLNRSVPDATGPRTEVAATEDEAFALKLGPAPVRGAAGTPQGRYQTRIEAEGPLWGPGAGRPAGRRL